VYKHVSKLFLCKQNEIKLCLNSLTPKPEGSVFLPSLRVERGNVR